MKNVFNPDDVNDIIKRINLLDSTSKPSWGKMDVAQMLAHCNVAYEMVYTDKHAKPNFFKKMILKAFVKQTVVGLKPYPKNGRTAPQFLMTTEKDFENEKKALINYLIKTQNVGEDYFKDKESHSFGKLKITEWNTLFYKHLNHHLKQFNV